MRKFIYVFFVLLMITTLTGCGNNEKKIPTAIVDTKEIKTQEITDSIISNGRLISEFSVDIVARVPGYLEKKFFKEGDVVKKGDLLFLIEQQTYIARMREAAADLQNAQASLKESQINLVRATELVKQDFISKMEYDNKLAKRDMDRANVAALQASLTQAKINYGYTKITAPISGKIGGIIITQGNYVTPESGTIVRLVSVDPIFVDFPLKSKDYLTLMKTAQLKDPSALDIRIKLADGTFYEHKGEMAFVNNEVDPTTGSTYVRVKFDNPKALLVQGDYVDVVCTLKTPESVLLVPQEAVLDSTDGKYLYTIDENNIAHKKFVKVDKVHNGNWVVEQGVSDGDVVAITGVQNIIPEKPVILKSTLKAQKIADKEIESAVKQSFFERVIRKTKRAIKSMTKKVRG